MILSRSGKNLYGFFNITLYFPVFCSAHHIQISQLICLEIIWLVALWRMGIIHLIAPTGHYLKVIDLLTHSKQLMSPFISVLSSGESLFNTYVKISEKLKFLTAWYVHQLLRIRVQEILVFRKICALTK